MGRNKTNEKTEGDEKREKVLNDAIAKELSALLIEKFGFATTSEVDRAMAEILKRTDVRTKQKGSGFSYCSAFRGMLAMMGQTLNQNTAEADVRYCKALSTGNTPGSFLVPTIQSEEFIEYLTLGGVARASGVRIWDMVGIQKLNVVSALASPTWVWTGQNSQQTPTDPNLGQLSFNLNERRAIVAVPNQLLAVSVPAFDTLLAVLLGASAGEFEDTAMFNTTSVSGGPTAMYAASGVTIINAGGGNANGGNLTFADLTTVLATESAAKAKPPFAWYCSPRTFWQRIYSMVDLQSRPLFIPTLSQGLMGGPGQPRLGIAPVGNLLGYPIYITPAILNTEAVGSGSNQSHLVLANPQYIHIAQDGAVAIAISTERYFDSNQTAVRAVQQEDFGYAPAQGITILAGVN